MPRKRRTGWPTCRRPSVPRSDLLHSARPPPSCGSRTPRDSPPRGVSASGRDWPLTGGNDSVMIALDEVSEGRETSRRVREQSTMSDQRRTRNPGKRERQAGKRHRRAVVSVSWGGAVQGPLKVGRRHLGRVLGRWRAEREGLAVADAETLGTGSEESLRQSTNSFSGASSTTREEDR